jgi:hypothetical protein
MSVEKFKARLYGLFRIVPHDLNPASLRRSRDGLKDSQIKKAAG